MKHIKLFEAYSSGGTRIPLDSDFYLVSDVSPLASDILGVEPELPLELRSRIYRVMDKFEPRYSYYYQDMGAVKNVHKQTLALKEEFEDELAELGWRIEAPVLGFYGSQFKRDEDLLPGEQPLYYKDQRAVVQTAGLTPEEAKAKAKQTAIDLGITHIGRIGNRVPVEKWDGDIIRH